MARTIAEHLVNTLASAGVRSSNKEKEMSANFASSECFAIPGGKSLPMSLDTVQH